ncbi:MAG: helix-turn-helix transcriptional regulator [Clostridiales Family XIII bacterium]|jgi:transcriptional regulator with XRE-family HTH domain|nr:helix-turn-helix transcriptional regulator [Clostridiales Family XIII bacterium]
MSKIQEQRKRAGLSQAGLAEKGGLPLRTLQDYEQGRRDINGAAVVTVKALADALGCRIEDLIEPTE